MIRTFFLSNYMIPFSRGSYLSFRASTTDLGMTMVLAPESIILLCKILSPIISVKNKVVGFGLLNSFIFLLYVMFMYVVASNNQGSNTNPFPLS